MKFQKLQLPMDLLIDYKKRKILLMSLSTNFTMI